MEHNSTSGPINIDQIDKLILYFYPRDNTPGCTSQAVMYSSNLDYFNKKGIKIIGVSKDSIQSHEKFIKKYDLKINLISDENLNLNKKFDVWKLKKFMGREYMGIHRVTYVINPEGGIHKVYDKVKTKTHAQDILNDL